METYRKNAAMRTLKQLVDAYNRHDASACAAVYEERASLWDQSWDETHEGRGAIERHYRQEFGASPDIEVSVRAMYFGDDTAAVEFLVRGTHEGEWRGLPATGNLFEITTWSAVRLSEDATAIRDSRFEYDRATVLQQLGVLHDPSSLLGKALTVISHPLTMARAARKRISNRPVPPS